MLPMVIRGGSSLGYAGDSRSAPLTRGRGVLFVRERMCWWGGGYSTDPCSWLRNMASTWPETAEHTASGSCCSACACACSCWVTGSWRSWCSVRCASRLDINCCMSGERNTCNTQPLVVFACQERKGFQGSHQLSYRTRSNTAWLSSTLTEFWTYSKSMRAHESGWERISEDESAWQMTTYEKGRERVTDDENVWEKMRAHDRWWERMRARDRWRGWEPMTGDENVRERVTDNENEWGR